MAPLRPVTAPAAAPTPRAGPAPPARPSSWPGSSGVRPTNYNPFAPSPAWPTAGGQSQLIYESLVRFNLLDGALSGGLAKEIQEPDANTFVLPLQDGTKWSDGSELTAEDVAFTFDLAKQTALSFSTIWSYVDSIEATDARTVTIKIKAQPNNPGFVKNVLAGTYIVPKAYWSKVAADKVTADTNLQPIGSGPFKLDKGDQTQINLKRDDAYWGKDVLRHTPHEDHQPSDLQERGMTVTSSSKAAQIDVSASSSPPRSGRCGRTRTPRSGPG